MTRWRTRRNLAKSFHTRACRLNVVVILCCLTIAAVNGNTDNGAFQRILLKTNDEPASNTVVWLVDRQTQLVLGKDLKVAESTGVQTSVTDSAGRFAFAVATPQHTLIVADPAGYVEQSIRDIGSKPSIRMRRWSRIEGTLMTGSSPAQRETVGFRTTVLPYFAYPRDFRALRMTADTTTDTDGQFVFERVPQGAVEAYHSVKALDRTDDPFVESQRTMLQPKEGETMRIVLGGSGRRVVGTITLKDYESKFDWRQDWQTLDLVVSRPSELQELDKIFSDQSEALERAWTEKAKADLQQRLQRQEPEILDKIRRFYLSDSGRDYYPNKRYALNFSQDGTFRAEDVPEGKYTLNINLWERSSLSGVPPAPLGQLHEFVQVPYLLGSARDYDLGTFTITPRRALPSGASAPEFEIKDVNGITVKMSDYKGKYVLLEFWAVWCPPCIEEAPRMKEIYDTFKTDERFAMVSLSLDPDPAIPRKYAAEHSLGWTQGFLGEWPPGPVANRYRVAGVPAIMLIGPDGKVLANRLRGTSIKKAVEAALRKE